MQSLRRSVTLLCLIAAVACPLMSRAVAAEGLAQSLAELPAPSAIEPHETRLYDGIGVELLLSEVRPEPAVRVVTSLVAKAPAPDLSPPRARPRLVPVLASPFTRPAPPPAPPPRRLAHLQRFLF